jgi:FixJ family two-component response regulator
MSEPAEHQPSVFVVDNDQQLLDSLVELLDALGFRVLSFSTPDSFMRFYRAEMPGCLILDICMPRQNGLDLYEQLLLGGKRIPVIFITAQADVSMAIAAMKTGATDLLEKPIDRKILLDRVEKALMLDAERRRQDSNYAAIVNRIEQLSDRERETLELIQAGESNKSMADKLFLSERAIEMRRATIMKKLRVGSVAELLNLVCTHRILTELRKKYLKGSLTDGYQ